MNKRFFSIILMLVLLVSALPFAPNIHAAEIDITSTGVNSLTLADVTHWLNNELSYRNWSNPVGGGECVEFCNYYLTNCWDTPTIRGNARDWKSQCPYGWTPLNRIYSFNDLQIGDLIVEDYDPYGHVAVYYGYEEGYHQVVDQNSFNGRYVSKHKVWKPCENPTYAFRPPIKDINPTPNPIGYLDIAESKSSGTIHVKGWAFDWDNTDAALDIHIYVGGPAGSGAPCYVIKANKERTDVNQVNPGAGNYHGFEETIAVSMFGNKDVYAYAINIGSGNDNPNLTLSPKTVNIIADNESPTCESEYLSMVTSDSFRVCVVPKDNVGINSVRIATWTQSDQSDLIWHDALFNGYDTYFIDIYRADYSSKQNSYYFNHAYIYDFAGNWTLVSIPQDYRITSDIGKSVPEGEYRIVTALDETKGLHIEDDSKDGGADIQINTNLSNPKQIFSIEYLNNGFYSVANINAPGCLMDSYGDTYTTSNVYQCNANGGANQEWMFKPTGDGYYIIVCRSNGLALDVKGAKSDNGTSVQAYSLKQPYEDNQKWKLRRVLKDDMVAITNWTQKNGFYLPNVIVTVDGQRLTEDFDYLVSVYIENNKLYAKITGVGNYCDSVSIEYQEPKCEIGDTDLDGHITISDVTAIQRHLAELEKFTDEQLVLADTNGDGEVDITDATHLQMHLAEYDGIVLGKRPTA